MNNREKLIDIMFDHQLDRQDLADLVFVDRQTVNSWIVTGESAHHVEVPDMAIELLTLKLKIQPDAADTESIETPDGG
jgi:hypothetical protein